MILAAFMASFMIMSFSPSFSNSENDVKLKKDTTKTRFSTNINGQGTELIMEFFKGKEHNHPTFAIWLEDMHGNFIQTLYVTEYFGTGIYGFGQKNDSVWSREPGQSLRPAALPYWSHKRVNADNDIDPIEIIPSPKNPVADAITGATPSGNFVMRTKTDEVIKSKFRLLMEINQTWDFNEYWTNNLYPDDVDYKTSCQPALVYAVTIDPESDFKEFYLNPIGHSHYSGKDGNLYTDLSTFTTALEIVDKVKVVLTK